jgi:hypothetical protein
MGRPGDERDDRFAVLAALHRVEAVPEITGAFAATQKHVRLTVTGHTNFLYLTRHTATFAADVPLSADDSTTPLSERSWSFGP